ncbi:MAG: glycoside hydrolase family 3 protein [Treponema sp.]|jgi:beta-N-acetylhexosaminidase|nr:glycoside hydrolase family 3 protein [Treponema sp.]
MRRPVPPLLAFLWILCLTPAAAGEGPDLRSRAEALAASLDDSRLAGQVLLTGLDGNGTLPAAMEALLRNISPGGVMLFRMNLAMGRGSVAPFLKTLSGLAAVSVVGAATIPPFLAADHEGGAVHRFAAGVERLPPPLSYWELAQKSGREFALKKIEEDAARSGAEIRGLGINLNLAPVAEILNDKNHAFLGDRSYGPDAAFVMDASAAFVRGMAAAGLPCVAKHFPGNSAEDPHSAAPVLTDDRETLDKSVLPLARLIDQDLAAGIMVSHAVVEAWDAGVNASRSRPVVSVWLRQNLGFSGMVLGDDFSMGAIAATGLSEEDAVIEALNAGVDMVMAWPRSLGRLHRAILGALKEGRLARERLEEAAARILHTKLRWGLLE